MKILTIRVLIGLLLLLRIASAQKTEGVLYFKDGTVKEGLVRLTLQEKVKFRLNKETKAVKYDFSKFSKVLILDGEEPSTYVQILARGHNGPQIVKQIEKGKVNLYHLITRANTSIVSPNNPDTGTMTSFRSYDIQNLYVLRKGENVATHLGSDQLFTKNFKRAASDFFKDCPLLVEKIENREYRKKNIQAIITFYNDECE